MKNKKAFIFPAFISEFTQKELDFLDQNNIDLNSYINKVSTVLQIDLPNFSYDLEDYTSSELYSQLLAYMFSCAFNDVLISKGTNPDFLAGYSMGIYASIYSAKSVSFEDGAKLIYHAFNLVEDLTQTKLYGMAAIIGLSVSDVKQLIEKYTPDLEIINVNNELSLVIAGKKSDIKILLQKAKDEGAITTAELTVNTPYHSKYLIKYSESFSRFINSISFYEPQIPIISTYNQRKIENIAGIKAELIFNLTQKINWYKTIQNLLEHKVSEMFECGAGKDLKKISRFICGDYQMKSIYKL